MKYEIDELDRGIIKHLSKNGRMSFAELATLLNVTEKTIRLRYKNLVDKEILNVVGVVNPIALGLKAGAIILLKVQPDSIKEVIEQVSSIPAIRYVTVTSGEYPLLVQITVESQEEITETIYQLNRIKNITSLNTIVQLDVYKNSFEYI
ncbi:AsnC family transcriptional regulator [Cytobacillus depressus]|uniref:AsnC family transcriptional regulator n=1 Tax=Cytobacillus depressus TaxID=1602942 RepID=A0A6L3V5Z8_9BACI|nr:AsnC family transcriptional regulator [Cytobacillus depressus]KAB2336654.1 AsnC family transcriptional regulator [Cytobacillus depressus]